MSVKKMSKKKNHGARRARIIKKSNDIQVDELIVGQIFDSYAALCRAVGREPAVGSSKPKLLKDFTRYFNYERDGRKFIITEIYDKPKPEEPRVSVNSKYTVPISNILLSYLNNRETKSVCVNKNNLYNILGFANNTYFEMQDWQMREGLKLLSEDMKLSDINHFLFRSNMKFYDIIRSFKIRANDRGLLFEDVYKVGVLVTDDEQQQSYLTYRDANPSEIKKIKKIREQVLSEIGLSNHFQAYHGKNSKAYYNRLDQLYKQIYGWDNVYSCYKIKLLPDAQIPDVDINEEKFKLNEIIIDTLNEQADNNYKKKSFEADPDNIMNFHYGPGYVEKQQLLANELIRIPANAQQYIINTFKENLN